MTLVCIPVQTGRFEIKLARIVANLILVAGLLSTKQVFAAGTQWNIVWSDEFTQADGSSPDSTKWGYDIGNGSSGWGNLQLEYDTARTNNARIVGGQLVIEARQESYGRSEEHTSELQSRQYLV